ncbi:TolC family protein [Pelagicoccus sp. SDUM812003]|uniref:TolC family protein n=1 Tax=Pelagicoccus sp. SDUM812003 TaxID=3041267 RepID=UPI00280E1A95|nr:TolC family protein [Pelagicoccus sp. SDUM812003]MDQ8205230.1 TolC family protein [Pelagicoccus sp. SDUM812003]
MTFRRFATFLALALTLLNRSLTAETEPETFTRSSAIRYALERNADLQAARLAVAEAEARLRNSGRLDNPRLSLEYGTDQAFNNEGEHAISVGFQQSFPLASRLKKEKAVSEIGLRMAQLEVRQSEREVAESICELALQIQVMEERIRLSEKLSSKARELARFANDQAATGEVSLIDANRATMELRLAEQALTHQKLEREKLIHRLAPLLGRRSAEHIHFESDGPITVEESLPSYDPAVLERHPAFQLASLAVSSAEAQIALARAQNWEDVTATVFWEDERSVDEPAGVGTDRFLGVGVTIPLPLRKKGDLKALEKQALRDRSRQEIVAIKLRIENDIEHARHEALAYRDRLRSYQSEVLELSQRQLESEREAHRRGQISYLELLQSELDALKLEENRVHLLDAYADARLELTLARVDLPELD